MNRSYWPDSEATGQLLTALCEGLAAEFDVHVLVGYPNATTGDSDWCDTDFRNGVSIHRVRHTRLPKSNMLLKGINLLSFAAAARRQILSVPQPDVVIFETDPFLLPFVADRLHRRTGCGMVGYLQDIYPDVAIALRKVRNGWWVRKLRARLFDVYARCERMIVLSSDMRQLLLDGGISDDRVRIIPNWADVDSVHPVDSENKFRERYALQDKFVVMYSGNLGLTQRLEDFVTAARLLQDDSKIQFVFVGRGARKADLENQVADLGLANVLFCDYQPLDELAHSLSAADLHLIPLTKELSRCLMPSKLYGILAAGRPYLSNAPADSELARLTLAHDTGIILEAGSPQDIVKAIRTASQNTDQLRQMGRNGRRLVESQYTKRRSTHAFSALLNDCLQAPAAG